MYIKSFMLQFVLVMPGALGEVVMFSVVMELRNVPEHAQDVNQAQTERHRPAPNNHAVRFINNI